MSKLNIGKPVTRRSALQAGAAMAALPFSGVFASQAKGAVTKVLDFTTGADVAKAEQEGEFCFYTHDSEPAGASIVEAFTKDFPKIKGRYVRAQNGALYSKVLAERSAGRYTVDVIQFSDPRPRSTSRSAAATCAMSRRRPSSIRPSISASRSVIISGSASPSPASPTTPTR